MPYPYWTHCLTEDRQIYVHLWFFSRDDYIYLLMWWFHRSSKVFKFIYGISIVQSKIVFVLILYVTIYFPWVCSKCMDCSFESYIVLFWSVTVISVSELLEHNVHKKCGRDKFELTISEENRMNHMINLFFKIPNFLIQVIKAVWALLSC